MTFIPVLFDLAIFDWAWVDDEEAELLSKYRWARSGTHAILTGRRDRSAPVIRPIAMHRLILGVKPGDGIVHHINEDPLDNRRKNLLHIPDKLAHGRLPHPRRDLACGRHYEQLPKFERHVELEAWKEAA